MSGLISVMKRNAAARAVDQINQERELVGAPVVELTAAEMIDYQERWRGPHHTSVRANFDPLVGLYEESIHELAVSFGEFKQEHPDLKKMKFRDFARVALFLRHEGSKLEFPG